MNLAFRAAEHRSGEIDQRMSRLDSFSTAQIFSMAREATAVIRPMVIDALLDQFAATVKSRTGKMAQALRNVTVSFFRADGKNGLRISLPREVSDYRSKGNGKGGDFYQAFGAINYGSVKRKGGGKKSAAQVRSDRNLKKYATEKITTVGGTRIQKGVHFFELSTGVRRSLERAWLREMNTRINRALGD